MFRFLTIPLIAAVLSFSLTALAGKSSKTVSGVVNLNQASVSQLELLPGVGAKTAEAIVAYRQKTKFARIEDLVQVKGLGKKKFDKMKAHLTVSGPTTISEGGGSGGAVAQADKPTAQARSAPPRR